MPRKTKKIHVVQMIHGLPYGGAERCVVDLANNLDPEKFISTVIIFRDLAPLRKELLPRVHFLLVEKKFKFDPLFYWRLKRALKKIRPDIVHTHLFTADFWGRLAAKSLKIPVVTTEHNTNFGEGGMKHFLKKMTGGLADAYVACSRAVKHYAEKYYGIKKNIEVIHNGIDLSKFAGAGDLNMNEPVKLIIIGRLTEQKGHAVALEALAKLKDYNWKLKVAGDGELKTELRKMAHVYGIIDRVEFMPATGDVPGLLAESHILIMPSLWEGLGVVAMEAMASGRLAVASRVGGLADLIEDGVTGYSFEPGEAKRLARKLEGCFTDFSGCEKIAQSGKVYASEHFGLSAMARAYEKIYRDLL